MIRFTGTVYYKDGREQAYEAGGAAQADWEVFAARHGYPLVPTPDTITTFPVKTWQLFLAWGALEVAEGFDVWRRTVMDVDSADEPELVSPTLPEATSGL
jgi:hypothetical protein